MHSDVVGNGLPYAGATVKPVRSTSYENQVRNVPGNNRNQDVEADSILSDRSRMIKVYSPLYRGGGGPAG